MEIRRKWLGVAAAGASAVLVLSACSGGDGGNGGGGGDDADARGTGALADCVDNPNTCNEGERADGGEITWVVNNVPGAWGAMSPAGGSVYTTQMLEGILPWTGQWAPDAETYEYNMDLLAEEPELLNDDIEEGPFAWRLHFSEDAVWNDGEPIGADDLRVTWMMATSPDEGHCDGCTSRAPAQYDNIESIEASDDGKTATVTLKEGEADAEWFAFFSAHSISGGLYPAHVAEQEGFDIDTPEELGGYFEWLHGNMPTFSGGPYIITGGDLENQVTKEINENWYGEVQPTLERITISFNTDEGTWISALNNGEIHGGAPAQYNEDLITQLRALDNVNFDIGPGSTWEHVDLNVENEWLQDVELRRAIFTAIDRDDIVQRNFGAGYPDYELKNNHVFDSASPYYIDHVGQTSQGTGDTEEALSILEEAGYEFDGESLTLDGEQVGPFRLRSTDTVVRSTSLQIIQGHLAEIGIEANIELTDDLGGTLGEQDYDIMQFGWSGSPFFTSNPQQYWHSDSGSNFGGYSNEQVDELTEAVSGATSLDEAADYANQAMEIVVDEAYVLPIMAEPSYIFVVNDYVNVRDNLHSSNRSLYNIAEWGLAAG